MTTSTITSMPLDHATASSRPREWCLCSDLSDDVGLCGSNLKGYPFLGEGQAPADMACAECIAIEAGLLGMTELEVLEWYR